MVNTKSEFELLALEAKVALSSQFPFMTKKNDYIEMGRVANYIYGIYLYVIDKPHIFFIIKAEDSNTYSFNEYTADDFQTDELLREIVSFVNQHTNLDENRRFQLIRSIASSLKQAINQLESPKLDEIQTINIDDDTALHIAFIHDKFADLVSDSYIKERMAEGKGVECYL